jgi:hypothetical protein
MAVVPVSSKEVRPAYNIYDPADALGNGAVSGDTADESVVVTVPQFISLINVPTGTTVSVQIKLDELDTFQEFVSITGADDNHLVDFEGRINYAKIVRSGVGDFVAFVQR